MSLNTRTDGVWYKRQDVALAVDKEFLVLSTVERNTRNHVLLTSFSLNNSDAMLPTYTTVNQGSAFEQIYSIMCTFSDNDDGALLAHRLQTQGGRLVGD